ncbi:hypothetical protein FRB94_007461 [Tulasnella sp. JGI-2019a]|nr:hypothetical protein FRB94_007461 [Tulasnella sp. JGI-2019a]
MSATKQAAQALIIREELGSSNVFWLDMGVLWEVAVTEICQGEPSAEIRQGCLYLGRFTRNLVAGVPQNQEKSSAFEPAFRRILIKTTSFFMMQDTEWNSITTALVQALSNIATDNEPIRSAIWPLYIDLKEQENIVLRSLASPDTRTVIATSVLMLNCVQGDPQNILQLVTKPRGIQICRAVLDRVNNHVEQSEEEESEDETFAIFFRLFQAIFNSQAFPRLWTSLTNYEEPITQHQTILLKLLDSYLQSALCATKSTDLGLISPLVNIHLELSDAARTALGGSDGPSPSAESRLTVDPRLPVLTKALVLTSQCIISLLLFEQENKLVLRDLGIAKEARSKNGMSLVDEGVDLLRRLDILLPRIILGREQHASNLNTLGTATAADDSRRPAGFEYIKRDLVRLLGILCHEDREIQDSVRERGGIPLIMNMCVIDERNPYLREHALFTLKNLLQDNPENKKLVDDIKPLDRWEAEGRLV